MRRTPPLILGAGPAGSAAAIVLAREGASPVLLDRDAEARDCLCGGFLSWRTAGQLRSLGIEPDTLGATHVSCVVLLSGGDELSLPLPAPAWGLSRRVLDNAMRRRALALGARLEVDTARRIEGVAVVGRNRKWDGESLFLATGKHDIRGNARPHRVADPALGLRVRLPASPARQRLLAGRVELHMFRGGYAGIVLQEDGSANVCLALRKSTLTAHGGSPARLISALAASSPVLHERLGDDWKGYPIETIGMVPYGWIAPGTRSGLFLLGDQAAVIPSLAGEGISIALASGRLAARFWIGGGPAAACAYQRTLARQATGPLRAARLARTMAESPLAAKLGMALARRLPPLLHLLMDASRIEPDASLAQARTAP